MPPAAIGAAGREEMIMDQLNSKVPTSIQAWEDVQVESIGSLTALRFGYVRQSGHFGDGPSA